MTLEGHDILNRERQRRKRWKTWLWIGIIVFSVLVVLGAVYAALYSNILDVNDISVSGNRFVSSDAIERELVAGIIKERQLLALLGPGNILFWYFGKNIGTLAPDEAMVADISADVDILAKKVAIVVEERKVKGIWCAGLPGSDDDCFAFDNDGIVFTKVPRTAGMLILKITDQNNQPLTLGNPILPKDDWIKNVFAALTALSANRVPISNVLIRDRSLEEWEVKVFNDVPLYFSLNFVPANFGDVLKNLSGELDLDKLSYLDFRVKDRIYYK
jgi:hypothetical protein